MIHPLARFLGSPIAASIVLLTVFCPTVSLGQEILRVAVSTSWNMPYAELQDNRLTGGIFSELFTAISQKTQRVIVPVVLPRKRIEQFVIDGDIDLLCLNPKWVPNPEAYAWSKPLFTINSVLFAHEGSREPLSLHGIPKGTAVSTTLGYVYPSLDSFFSQGLLIRDDAIDDDKVLRKMTAGRTPLGLVDSFALDWYRKTVPQHKLAPWKLVVDSQDVYCAVPKISVVPATRVLAAIEDLRKSGRIDAILHAYR